MCFNFFEADTFVEKIFCNLNYKKYIDMYLSFYVYI